MNPSNLQRFSQRYPWYAVIALTVVYIFAMIDRQIISLVVSDLKRDLGLNDFQIGLLMGPAFGVFYILGGPLFGMLVDRFSRKRVLMIGLTTWSVAASACGLASSFVQLFVARMLVGAGEASVAPSSYSLISDLFPRRRIALALSVFAIGGTVGGGLSLVIGGLILRAVGAEGVTIPVLGTLQNWQVVFIATGAPGLLLLLIVWSLHEPRETQVAASVTETASRPELRDFLHRRRALVLCHFVAFCSCGLVAYSVVNWSPEYLMRTFEWTHARAGIAMGAIVITTSVLSHLLTGSIVDHLFARGVRDAHFRVYLYMLLAALPVMVGAYQVDSPYVFLVGLFLLSSMVIPFTAFASSSLQVVTPPRLRGVMSGFFLGALGLVGLSIGPSMVGFVTEYVMRDDSKLGVSISLVGGGGMLIAILALAIGLKHLRHAVGETAESARLADAAQVEAVT